MAAGLGPLKAKKVEGERVSEGPTIDNQHAVVV